jgi:PAS domain S-box-containing protein
MDDLFSYEQEILDDAQKYATELNNEKYSKLVKAYGKLLKQLRSTIKISDRTTKALNNLHSKADELNTIIMDRNSALNYDIMKYELANRALNSGMWDMEVDSDDLFNSHSTVLWSERLRRMLGFSDETDFPNLMHSLDNRIHPSDKERIDDAFYKHLTDLTGQTQLDSECRLQMKSGEYRWFRAIGETVRDDKGTPLRIAGLLLDIDAHKQYEELRLKAQAQEYENKIKEEQIKLVLAFSVTINHEINQHLTVLQLALDIIKTKQDFKTMSKKDKEHWDKVDKSIMSIYSILAKYITHSENMNLQRYIGDVQMVTFDETKSD